MLFLSIILFTLYFLCCKVVKKLKEKCLKELHFHVKKFGGSYHVGVDDLHLFSFSWAPFFLSGLAGFPLLFLWEKLVPFIAQRNSIRPRTFPKLLYSQLLKYVQCTIVLKTFNMWIQRSFVLEKPFFYIPS